jgi:hypothetical protein
VFVLYQLQYVTRIGVVLCAVLDLKQVILNVCYLLSISRAQSVSECEVSQLGESVSKGHSQ